MTADTEDENTKWLDEIISSLISVKNGKPVNPSVKDCIKLCDQARVKLMGQPMLLDLGAPIKICGDIHGQFSDLLRLFEYGGFPPESNYLFLGDYVDRGKQSIEVICLLFAYKIKYPENFFILRGNHEAGGINRIYGFYDECRRRYTVKLWKTFCSVFDCLPCTATVDSKIICMHGGLSPELQKLEQIENLRRPCDVPDSGLLCDLLWSDPDASSNVSFVLNDFGSLHFNGEKTQEFISCRHINIMTEGCLIHLEQR